MSRTLACGLLITLCFITVSVSVYAEATPAWFNSGLNNRDITFSPDGNIMLSTMMAPRNQTAVIVISYRHNENWTPLEVAPFSGQHPDIEPAFSPDGRHLYFASKRPKPSRDGEDWDLWRVPFIDSTWGTPEHLGDSINTEGNEFYPSVTNGGVLYFTATREDSIGKEDIYRTNLTGANKGKVENIGGPVNTEAYEFNAFIAPDESYLLFGSQGREGETGGGDIYLSRRTDTGFAEPILLPETVNTSRLDYCPTVFQERLYFTSERFRDADLTTMSGVNKSFNSPGNGLGDIYWVNFDATLAE